MNRFLERLASSVHRPQPNLHPFVESIFPAPLHVSSGRSTQAQEISVATSQREQSASRPAPLLQSQPFTPTRSPEPEVQSQPSAARSSAREETITRKEQIFRPLLPVREAQGSDAISVISPIDQPIDATSPVTSDPRTDSTPDKERVTRDSAVAHITTMDLAEDQSRAAKQPPPHSQFEVPSLLASRKPVPAATLFVPRTRQETHTSDEIQINIGRIEVIAAPPLAPRSIPAPARKGISLDEYLSRRDGRVR
jgi:hypothetical protein